MAITPESLHTLMQAPVAHEFEYPFIPGDTPLPGYAEAQVLGSLNPPGLPAVHTFVQKVSSARGVTQNTAANYLSPANVEKAWLPCKCILKGKYEDYKAKGNLCVFAGGPILGVGGAAPPMPVQTISSGKPQSLETLGQFFFLSNSVKSYGTYLYQKIYTGRPLITGLDIVPTVNIGIPASIQVAATQGVPPYLYYIDSGTLPAGLTLDRLTGIISGTPLGPAGLVPFQLRVMDLIKQVDIKGWAITVV